MSKKFLLFVTLVFVHSFSWATMFSPLPFDKQVEEATSAVEATVAGTKVFKNASGLIMTEYTFDVSESYNVSDDDLENHQLKLTMPGGTYEGITSMIDGAPTFAPEEKSFLLLKKIESKLYLSNFTLGKFKIQQYEGKTYYVSEVFPMDPNIGRISKDKMVDLMKTKWKISSTEQLTTPGQATTIVAKAPPSPEDGFKFEKREPAQEASVNQDVPVFFWSAIVLVAFFFALIFFKLGQSEHQHKRE